jgi:hypothetical protein
MRNIFLTCSFILVFAVSYSQITTNDSLIVGYVNDFIKEGSTRGLHLRDDIIENVNYILVAPSDIEDLGRTNKDEGIILLSNDVQLDKLILKATLYRELFHILGVPYDNSFIMTKQRPKGFSYSAYAYSDVMKIELDRTMELLE